MTDSGHTPDETGGRPTCEHGALTAHVDDNFLTGARVECPGPVTDLMAALRASLDAARAEAGGVVTDQADTPDPIGGWLAVIERYYGTDSLAASVYQRATLHTVARDLAEGVGVGNAAAAKLATLLAESVAEVRALRAENVRLRSKIAGLEHAIDAGLGINIGEIKLRAELAAARDREAAVRALHREVEWQACSEDGTPDLDKPLPSFCGHCTDPEYVNAIEYGDTIDAAADVAPWPCPTIAALAALEH